MLGFRGASRYYSPRYRDGFALECHAVRRLREEMGFLNVTVMIPFCRSTSEADRVLAVMGENGLVRGQDGLEVFNDLTQLTLGVDRDSGELSHLFDEQDEAVKWMVKSVIRDAQAAGAKVGLCGQAPSDHPEFAEFLVACGIDSISVSPHSFIAVKRGVAQAEAHQRDAKKA